MASLPAPRTYSRHQVRPSGDLRVGTVAGQTEGGWTYSRTEEERALLADDDDGVVATPRLPSRKGRNNATRPTTREGAARPQGGYTPSKDVYRVAKEAPTSSSAAALVTLRQQESKVQTVMAMHRASMAFPKPGTASDNDKRIKVAPPPAALALLQRQMEEENDLRRVRDGSKTGRGKNTMDPGQMMTYFEGQRRAMVSEARAASQFLEERLMASVSPHPSPRTTSRGGGAGGGEPSIALAQTRSNPIAVDLFRSVLDQAALRNDAVNEAAQSAPLPPPSRSSQFLPTLPPSREGARAAVSTSRRVYDERGLLSSRQRSRGAKSATDDSVLIPFTPRTNTTAPSTSRSLGTASRAAVAKLTSEEDDTDEALVVVQGMSGGEAGTSVKFRLSDCGGASSSRAAQTPRTVMRGGGATSAGPVPLPDYFEELAEPEKLLRKEFNRWAPTTGEESGSFASLSKWATMAFERARCTVEGVAAAEASGRGTLIRDLEVHFSELVRQHMEREEARQSRLERLRQSAEKSGVTVTIESDDDDDQFEEVRPLHSSPSRHMLNVTLLILELSMQKSEPFRELWPSLRDELYSALFVDYRREVSAPIPLTGDEVLDLCDANSPGNVPRQYWDPTLTYHADDPETPTLNQLLTVGLSCETHHPPPMRSSLESLENCRATFEEYRKNLAEHRRVAKVIAMQAKASDRLAAVMRMAFDRSSRRMIVGAFYAWRNLVRQASSRRRGVLNATSASRARRTVSLSFREWRRVTLQAKLQRTEKKLEEANKRIVTISRDHAETVSTMNARYHADVKALEFELFQEAESRKNMLQVHTLEQEEWAAQAAMHAEETKTLRRVVRQWQRAAQLSTPVDDSTPPPLFLVDDARSLKQLDDQLSSYFVNTAHMAGTSGGSAFTTITSPLILTNTGSFGGAVLPSTGGVIAATTIPEGNRVVDPIILDYIATGWQDSIPPPPPVMTVTGGNVVSAFTEAAVGARRELETFLCTWVNYELRHAKAAVPNSSSSGTGAAAAVPQITNCTQDLRDGTIYLALCRALTPKEHQRRGDLDVYLTLTSLMGLNSAHGLVPPLLLHCPYYSDFFSPTSFRTPLPGVPNYAHAHPTGGLWILSTLFVARCLKTITNSKYSVHVDLQPSVKFCPSVVGMPRPPAKFLICAGVDPTALTTLTAASESFVAGASKSATASSRPAATSAESAKRRGSHASSRGGKRRLTVRSLSIHSGGSAGRRRPGSAGSSSAESSASGDSEYDEDDEWLAHEDDDNFRIAIHETIRTLGPSELIAHWIKLRRNGELWTGLARVVTSLVLRHRVLDIETHLSARAEAALKAKVASRR